MNKRGRIGIIAQISILFVIGILANGLLVFYSQYKNSDRNVIRAMEIVSTQCAGDAMAAFKEYPAYNWLVEYWYEHPDEMDIEYDVGYSNGTRTREKNALFSSRNPGIQLRYATEEELEALPEEDQKLYAEIIYSWVLTRLDQIKTSYGIDYVFCVVASKDYSEQFFIMTASDGSAARGMGPENAYLLGKQVQVSESQKVAMREAKESDTHFADAGEYVDYYVYFGSANGNPVMMGLTYSLADIRNNVKAQTWRETGLSMSFQIILSAVYLVLVYFLVLRPVKKIHNSIRIYEDTKDSDIVRENISEIRVKNEIGQLGESLEEMTSEIDSYVNEIASISAERERMEAELNLASRIQANSLPNIFPPFPDRKEFELYASMKPARQVGGDFYDFFMIDDDHIAMIVADVAGKGVPAALFMMISMVVIHNYAVKGTTPKEVLKKMNESICLRNPEEMFVSVWLGIVEISTGKLTASNAGHEYPLIRQPGEEFKVFKDKHGIVIGAMKDSEYTDYTIDLKPGAEILIYTDGVPEATNADMELFGIDRLTATVNRYNGSDPEELIGEVKEAVADFVQDAEQFDDLTMLSFLYKG